MRSLFSRAIGFIENRRIVALCLCAVLLGFLFNPTVASRAASSPPKFSILHSFTPASLPGSGMATVVNGNVLYGMTGYDGSTYGSGTIYKINLDGTGFSRIYRFGSDPYDAQNPSTLVCNGRRIFGTTTLGGQAGHGTLFTINTDGTGYAKLLEFTTSGLIYPTELVLSGATLYGIALDANSAPVLYKINTDGTGYANVFSFGTVPNAGSSLSQMILYGSVLYGTTDDGGANGKGTIFKINLDGTGYTLLHSFSTLEGLSFSSLLCDGTALYGIARTGGPNDVVSRSTGSGGDGTVFKINVNGSGFAVLHDFGATRFDGVAPTALALDDNVLYGATQNGGSPSDDGIAFRIGTDGTAYADLYNFNGETFAGADPLSLSVNGNHQLVGMAQTGGVNGQPVLFQLSEQGDLSAWSPVSIAAIPGGGTRVLWRRNDGAMGLWNLDATNTETQIGQTYGPYVDAHGAWGAGAVCVAPDGSSRVLWGRSDNAAGVWDLDADGNLLHVGPVYGPYNDPSVLHGGGAWAPSLLALSPDGKSHLLWIRADLASGVWTLDASGTETAIGPTYGPYTNTVVGSSGYGGAWVPNGLGAAGDGTLRVLWVLFGGNETSVGLWNLDADGHMTNVGPTYGPYSDANGAWSPTAFAVASDGTSRLLWTRDDGASGLWSFDAQDHLATVGAVYGPYASDAGIWTATSVSVDANGSSRVLWTHSDLAFGVWSFGTNDLENLIGPVYGPY